MKQFSIRESLRYAWDTTVASPALLGATALYLLFAYAFGEAREVGRPGTFKPQELSSAEVVAIVFAIPLMIVLVLFISYVVSAAFAGYTKFLLKLRDGEEPRVSEVFTNRRYAWRVLWTSVAFFLLVGVGLVLFVVPGLYFLSKYLFAPVLAVDKDTSFGASFRESARITKGNRMRLLKFVLLLLVAMAVGSLNMGLAFVVLAVFSLAEIDIYRKLSEPLSGEVPLPAEPEGPRETIEA